MNKADIVKALRNKSFRNGLTAEQQNELPSSNIGTSLTSESLVKVSGGIRNWGTTPDFSCVQPGQHCP